MFDKPRIPNSETREPENRETFKTTVPKFRPKPQEPKSK